MLRWIEAHLARSVMLALGVALALYELSVLVFAYSADAYVTTDVVLVAPEVAGPIAELPVRENQRVAAGMPLLAIEPRPFALALASAQAAVDLAQRQQALAAEAVAELESLAKRLGGALGASRDVTDAGWLPKSRQIASRLLSGGDGPPGARDQPRLNGRTEVSQSTSAHWLRLCVHTRPGPWMSMTNPSPLLPVWIQPLATLRTVTFMPSS